MQKAPTGPSWDDSSVAFRDVAMPGIGSSHTPRNARAMANTRAVIDTLNHVNVLSSPQSKFRSPRPSCTATASVASTINTEIKPAE
jgi:hypothetical protein